MQKMCLRSLIDRNDYYKNDQMPTEWEQDVAEIYVNERQLVRPDVNIKTAFIFFLLFLLVTGVFTWFVHFVFYTFGFFAYFPLILQSFCNEHQVLSILILCVFFELIFCFKYVIIGIIKLYQHYAPEEIRRRCLFMPTCSEYAILAIRKYGGIIGILRTYYRLVYRCRGNIYQIDYP